MNARANERQAIIDLIYRKYVGGASADNTAADIISLIRERGKNEPYLIQEGVDCQKIECPECKTLNDGSDGDGMVCPGDFECSECDAPYEITDVVVRGTVAWRKHEDGPAP